MKILHYQTLSGKADHYFDQRMAQYLAKGWQPWGSPGYMERESYGTKEMHITQAIVIYEPQKKRSTK